MGPAQLQRGRPVRLVSATPPVTKSCSLPRAKTTIKCTPELPHSLEDIHPLLILSARMSKRMQSCGHHATSAARNSSEFPTKCELIRSWHLHDIGELQNVEWIDKRRMEEKAHSERSVMKKRVPVSERSGLTSAVPARSTCISVCAMKDKVSCVPSRL